MKKILIIFIFIFSFLIMSDTYVLAAKTKKNDRNADSLIQVNVQSYPVPQNNYKIQNYQGINYSSTGDNFVLIPINTVFSVNALTPVNSDTAKKGDRVSFYFVSDFYYKSALVAPSGSKINGTVLSEKKDELLIKFTNITTSTGQIIPVYAQIQTQDGSGILKAQDIKNVENKGNDNLKKYTSQTGAVFNFNKYLKTENGNVIIPQNAQLNLILNQPVTVLSNTPF